MKKFFLFLFSLLMLGRVSAQVSVKDSSIYTPMLGFSYGYFVPGGDLSDRFGNNSAVQLDLDFKTRKYWMFGINGSYIFGKVVKESLFDSIDSPGGYIINKNGEFADIRKYERGFTLCGSFGRMFAFKKPNPNSGIVATVGIGLLQHKIRIETIGNNVPQLSKEYKKGYDRLTNGLLLTQDIGYMYLSNNRLVNGYIGVECMEAFTKSRRSFDYELMMHDTRSRVDMMFGVKLGWILPLYRKAPQEFYTY